MEEKKDVLNFYEEIAVLVETIARGLLDPAGDLREVATSLTSRQPGCSLDSRCRLNG